jgi:hypothetical protein
MSIKSLLVRGLLHAVGVGLYVALVSAAMRNGEQIFGTLSGMAGPLAFLLLFVVSAAITGALVLGKPLLLYLDGEKKQSLELFGFTVSWLIILFFAILLFAFFFS